MGKDMEQRGPAYSTGDSKLMQWLWEDGLEYIISLAIRIAE